MPKRLSLCCFPECPRHAVARHLCQKHYMQKRTAGTLHEIAGVNVKTGRAALCSVEGCTDIVNSQGMCNKHYKRFLAYGDVNTVKTIFAQQGPCGAIGCGKIIEKGGFCQKHYLQWWRTGFPYRQLGEPGLWYPHAVSGYMVGTVDGIRMYEHRYLAEKALGKSLPAGAEVHHMNGNKADNKTYFNLVVCPDRAYHMLLEKRTKDLGREALMRENM